MKPVENTPLGIGDTVPHPISGRGRDLATVVEVLERPESDEEVVVVVRQIVERLKATQAVIDGANLIDDPNLGAEANKIYVTEI